MEELQVPKHPSVFLASVSLPCSVIAPSFVQSGYLRERMTGLYGKQVDRSVLHRQGSDLGRIRYG